MTLSAKHRRTDGGFTLIEVMIVVAIIGILSMVAYPSYKDYILRGQLVQGANALSTTRADMERFYQDNRTYLGATAPCTAGKKYGTFTVTCVARTATTYTLQAQGSAATASFTYQLTEADIKKTTAAPTGYGTCATDWILKKGQSCS